MSVKENIISCIAKIKREKTNSFIEIFEERALAKAEEIDRVLASGGRNLPLAGAPVALKDNMVIKGETASCSSKILKGFVSPYDAEVVTRLEKAGAI
ncbi:Asp-tRNA(Asn)/Glu-tRNA(Gln) amidotransferase subunit GatA, partial [bacterium]|nr:Asp-tRNA(Asn)/Glu-tRNA(Gln) amidotransferase subunit GatA [bacterium]MBU3955415.1 Asp-tRNA(Asn)/Glu-tRNA(Gln) amidotransferase subunit GatA [bacterium]